MEDILLARFGSHSINWAWLNFMISVPLYKAQTGFWLVKHDNEFTEQEGHIMHVQLQKSTATVWHISTAQNLSNVSKRQTDYTSKLDVLKCSVSDWLFSISSTLYLSYWVCLMFYSDPDASYKVKY